MSITEDILRWMNTLSVPATFSIGTISEETNYDRRQVTTVLHSLAKGALPDLERVGKGLWRYAPANNKPTQTWGAEVFDTSGAVSHFRYTPRDGLHPGDSIGQGTVIACTRTAEGFYYTVRDDEGGLWHVTPIYSVDSLLPASALLAPPNNNGAASNP